MFPDFFRPATGLFILLASVFFCGVAATYAFEKKRYQIEDGSKLYLKGTSNVNAFTCDCGDRFEPQTGEVESNGGFSRFQHVQLAIRTANFDCHNRKIDRDMQTAMRAREFPFIKIVLKEARHHGKNLDNTSSDWFTVQAKTAITITDQTREHQILAKAKKIDERRFRLRGEKTLQMSEFGIDPPEAMFGLIKVNDWISFHFDLIVRVDE